MFFLADVPLGWAQVVDHRNQHPVKQNLENVDGRKRDLSGQNFGVALDCAVDSLGAGGADEVNGLVLQNFALAYGKRQPTESWYRS